MTLQEFVNTNDVAYETVRIFIKRHKLETLKDSKGRVILPDSTLNVLEKQYQKKQPLQVIEDPALLKKILQLQDKVIELQERLEKAATQMAEKNADIKLLESQKQDMKKLLEENEKQKEQIKQLKGNADELGRKLDHMRHRTLWQRIRNK